jgi:general secretion pathway protein H
MIHLGTRERGPERGRERTTHRRKRAFSPAGFTLIELIVVMALMGIVLFVSVPRIEGTFLQDDAKKSSRWLIAKIQMLRENAVREQVDFLLHLDLDTNRIWETHASMTAEALQDSADNAQSPPGMVRLAAVNFPRREAIRSGQTALHFYRAGYSDKALIQLLDGDRPVTLLVEPFLPGIETFERAVYFED